jgi:hypothetical protein
MAKTKFKISSSSRTINELVDGSLQLWSKKKLIRYKNKAYDLSPDSVQRWVFEQKYDKADGLIRNLYLDFLISAENIQPGSSVYLPLALKNEVSIKEAGFYNSDLLLNWSSDFLHGKSLAIFEAMRSVLSSRSRIVLKKGNFKKDTIEIKSGARIPIGMDHVFEKMINYKNLSLTDVKVIVIDGAPSTVGELNSMFQKASEEKWKVLLLAKSFAEEVSSTLAVNWTRNSLSIVPIRYGLELESINAVPDICALSGAMPISPMLGDTISSSILKRDKHGYIKNVTIDENYLKIEPEKYPFQHVKNLIEEMNSSDDTEKQRIYSNRISDLSSEVLEINVNSDNPLIFEKLDHAIKKYQQYTRFGAAKTNVGIIPRSYVNFLNTYCKNFKEKIKNIGGFVFEI